jgi:hypothetical protein
MSNDTVDAIRRGLRNLTAPEPQPQLLARILESRATGIRVALPLAGRSYRRWIVGALAAAATVVLVMSTGGRARPPVRTGIDYQDLAAALSFWPQAAIAQQPGLPRLPRYDLVRHLDADRVVHAGAWTYDICATIDDELTKCRSRLTIELREAQREQRPAWLMIQRVAMVRDWSLRPDTIHVPPDTTYFTRETLRPIAWSIVGDRIRVERHFSFDSVHETLDITGPDPRSWRARGRLPGAADAPLVLRWARYDVVPLLQALPLAPGWRGSVYSVGLIGPVPRGSPFPPLDMRVVGRDRIDVPAGRFDCWKIEMRMGDETVAMLWASKDRGWLIKATQGTREWRTESTLVSATPPAP